MGALELHLDDDRGHTGRRRSYDVEGELELEDAFVVAPAGFNIPQDNLLRD